MDTIGIICSGPSPEKGISLNSARTLQDHLNSRSTKTKIYFVDQSLNFFLIDSHHLYSNTPSDFDFKIRTIATPIKAADLEQELRTCSLIFPLIHGPYGEDGTLQRKLEQAGVPYVGSDSKACVNAYLKHNAQNNLKAWGFPTMEFLNIDSSTSTDVIQAFWRRHCEDQGVIKPTNSGSSLDVIRVSNEQSLIAIKNQLLAKHSILQLQPFCALPEVTLVCIGNLNQEPIALLPTETQLQVSDTGIFDYRSKYLPTNACRHFTPANISDQDLDRVRKQAQDIFKCFQLKDFARLDGWVCPVRGFVCCDINIISGFEENSFLFKQASACGMTHKESIEKILASACHRQNLPEIRVHTPKKSDPKPVYVILGGSSSERQVSLMSGRNVWFKLAQSSQFELTPFFMDKSHRVWKLPYELFLQHTVEEISDDIKNFSQRSPAVKYIVKDIKSRLNISTPPTQEPRVMHVDDWISMAKDDGAFVFLGLHGGIGENGTLQKKLNAQQIPYNGSGPIGSERCMDKNQTIRSIEELGHPDIQTQKQYILSRQNLLEIATQKDEPAEDLWARISHVAPAATHIIKPLSDGCSSGIVCLKTASDIKTYAQMISAEKNQASGNTFFNQPSPIELPSECERFLIEPYIETDLVEISNATLRHEHTTGWHELTIVVREKNNVYHAFNPSITVKEHAVLSVEEKFQGGTGVNLTPPPEKIISEAQCRQIKSLACIVAQQLGIQQYARLDIFYNTTQNRMQLIEANTLPALTPSTVLFQQALAETPAIQPREFLESLVLERFHALQTVEST